jgi:hypothetical protein
MKIGRRVRLQTLLLLIVALSLLIDLYLIKRRQSHLLDAVAFYRQPRTEAICDVLNEPLATVYPDGAALEDMLKDIKARTTGKPKLKSGIPIYVDPRGLQEANHTMTSKVKRPVSSDRMTLSDQIRQALEPLGLVYEVKDGFMMITSKESRHASADDALNLYLEFRDVLQ